MARGLIALLGLITLSSVSNTTNVKEGYYFSSFGHAAILYKIDSRSIELYVDNTNKYWARGTYKINVADSVLEITYSEIWRSNEKHGQVANDRLALIWDEDEQTFKLREYKFNEKTIAVTSVKRRVRSSCKIKESIK